MVCIYIYVYMHYIFQSHQLIDIFQSLRNENHPRLGNRTERKEAGLLGPTKSRLGQTWPSLALSWAEQDPTWAQLARNLRRTRASWLQLNWAQLEPNCGPTWRNLGTFGRKLGLACATWSCVEASGAEVGPEKGPMWEPPSEPKKRWNRDKMLVFSVPPWVRKNGPGWARGRLSPVQHGATCLATASRQVGPYWAQHRKHCSTRSVIDTKKRRKFQRKRAFWGFRLGPGVSPILKPYGPQPGEC